MARIDNINNFLTDVADSIRTKTGKSDKISASSFDTEIASITTSEDLDSELATYNTELTEQEESLSGIVEYLENKIESGEPLLLQDKAVEIKENGTTNIVADEGYDGLNSIEVTTNIESSGGKYAPRFISFYGYAGTDLEYELANLDINNMTSMNYMFRFCAQIETLDLTKWNWDTSNIESMYETFYRCSSLNELNVNNIITNNVTAMFATFEYCTSLKKLDLSNWTTNNVTEMPVMFYGCTGLTQLDIRNFDFSNVTNYTNMFGDESDNINRIPSNCLIIVKDTTAKSWITSKFTWLKNVKTVAELEG